MARRASFRSIRRGPRRRSFWRSVVFEDSDTETISGSAVTTPRIIAPTATAVTGNTALPGDSTTIARLRGSLSVQTALGSAERVLFTFGLILLNTDDQGNFVEAAVPGPISDDFGGWMWRGSAVLPGDAAQGSAITVAAGQLLQYRFDIDTKAMRKQTLNQGVALIWQAFAYDAVTSETFEFGGYLASLILE